MKKIKALNAVLCSLLLTLGVSTTLNNSKNSKVVNAATSETYNFGAHASFKKWSGGYAKRTLEYDVVDVIFASACKQTSTITDMPVTRGDDVEVVAKNGCSFKELTLTCKQWTTKTQTIILHTSNDGGETYTETNITSDEFSLSANNLPSGTNAVKFTFGSSSQIGISAISFTYEQSMTNAFLESNTLSRLSYDWTKIETSSETLQTWKIVTDVEDLHAGDKIVLASNKAGVTAGDISNNIMSTCKTVYSLDKKTIASLGDDTVELTLGGTSGAWTLENNEGKLLGATANKKVAWDSGTTTWGISIDANGNATIQNSTSTFGKFLHNSSSPRFTTYTSDPSDTMFLPQIYKFDSVETKTYDYSVSNVHLQFGGLIDTSIYEKLAATEVGVVLAKSEAGLKDASATDRKVYNLTEAKATVTLNEDGTTVEDENGNYYQFGVNVSVPEANYSDVVYAVVYAVVGGNVIYMNTANYSVKTIAQTYMDSKEYVAYVDINSTLDLLAKAA